MNDQFWQAIQSGDLETLKSLLIEQPSLLDEEASNGHSPLRMACDYQQPEVSAWLAGIRPVSNAFDAAALGDDSTVRSLVEADSALLSGFSHDGATLLHLACFFGHQELSIWLVDQGADLKTRSNNYLDNTPLHAALAGARLPDLVRYLVESGADVSAVGGAGATPLHLAAARGDQALVDLLLEHGAESVAMSDGQLPADLASGRGFPELAAQLRKA